MNDNLKVYNLLTIHFGAVDLKIQPVTSFKGVSEWKKAFSRGFFECDQAYFLIFTSLIKGPFR